MVPKLYDSSKSKLIGDLINCISCLTTEERNGTFSLSLTYPITDSLHEYLVYGNLIEVTANDEQRNQLFRILATDRIIKGTVTVTALHISFDLLYDYVANASGENTTCEDALNHLFQSSEFSSHYIGISDIENPQNYSISDKNVAEAICGSEGSLIDTFGLGAEIKRDNTTISILNERGANNGVTIEYGVNMLDELLEVDTTDLTTVIYPYATYVNEDAQVVEVRGSKITSELVGNYCHPFISFRDYTQFFVDNISNHETAKAKIEELARQEFEVNKVDRPRCSYTIDFIPLSKCIGYENIQDSIHLCDTVRIKDYRYGIDTEAKIIKYTYDVLKEMYETMELGDPKSTLTDVIQNEALKGDKGEKGEAGQNGNLNDFPDTLPNAPEVKVTESSGTLFIQWSYVSAIYYTYEVYASTVQGFTPNATNLIYSGQSSSYSFTATPDVTWYFRVRIGNTHGRWTSYSAEQNGTAKKIDSTIITIGKNDIKDYMIDTMSLARTWTDTLSNTLIDFKNTYIKNENMTPTLSIDDKGNVSIKGASMQVYEDNEYKDLATKDYVDANAGGGSAEAIEDLTTTVTNIEKYVDESIDALNTSNAEMLKIVNESATQVTINTGAITEHSNMLATHSQAIEENKQAITQYDQDLTSLEENINTNNTNIGLINENINTMNGKFSAIDELILGLQAQILNLQQRVAVLEGTPTEPEEPEVPEEGGEDNEGDIEE